MNHLTKTYGSVRVSADPGPKIIGGGMVARAFVNLLKLDNSVTIFASGVSNSDCIDPAEFARESALLSVTLKEVAHRGPFLYFGTCSIYDSELNCKPYVTHKKSMENMVLSYPTGCVVRLPQLAGSGAPANTLIPFLVTKIREDGEIKVWKNAWRYVIDVEDVVKIVSVLLQQGVPRPRVINVANPVSIPIYILIQNIESVLKRVAKTTFVSKGSHYEIDTTEMLIAAASANVHFGEDYILKVIKKYYK